MKRSLIIFFQVIVVLVGISTFIFLLLEPQFEGRNINATFFEIYFKDLFLMGAYAASILFFAILYQIFKVLNDIKQKQIFSPTTIKSLGIIKYCAVTLIILLVMAEGYLFIVQSSNDDIAGGVAMGLFLIFIFTLITTVTTIVKWNLQKTTTSK